MQAADIDFETYSEAGYYWDGEREKWRPINSSPPYGLPAVGAAAYAEHPSTCALSLAYQLPGRVPALWVPHGPRPYDLFDWVQRGGMVCAWNSMFEYLIWHYVCHLRMGWPPLPLEQTVDDMARAKAWGLPGALAKAGEAINAAELKDKEGARLLRKFSVPRSPTKHDKRTRIDPAEDPTDGPKLYGYNLQDIAAERAIADRCPPLSDLEHRIWQMDQRINARGVRIDRAGMEDCKSIIEQATRRYSAELQHLTGGAVDGPTKLEALKGWMEGRGVPVDSLDADAAETVLARDDVPDDVRRAVEIRVSLGAASVKKLYAIDRRLCSDDRLRELFAYYGAERTGRWAGRGPQPQNLPGSGPDAARCSQCRRHYSTTQGVACPRCGGHWSDPVEWGIACAEDALADISTRDLDYVERVWGDAVAAVSGCLRALFCASPGMELISSDFTAIEAVVLAAIAGEQWRLDTFRRGDPIYEVSASQLFGVPLDEILEHKRRTGSHHPLRKKGKVGELACLGPGTQVLTSVGYVNIKDITNQHELWDGREWVRSDGAISKGARMVINLDGVTLTPDHPVSLGELWVEAGVLDSNRSILLRALEIASENLPSSEYSGGLTEGCEKLKYDVHAGRRPITLTSVTSGGGRVPGVIPALKGKAPQRGASNITGSIKNSCLTTKHAVASLTGYLQRSAAAIMRKTAVTATMAPGVFLCAMSGGEIKRRFWSMSGGFRGMTCRSLKWTGSTLTADTSPATSSSYPVETTCSISAKSPRCSNVSSNWSDVYDIVNAGPRSRFTIKTRRGHLIVHNSGYQGSVGAWRAFGAEGTDDEILQMVRAWRQASPAIPQLWYGLEDAARNAIKAPGHAYTYTGRTGVEVSYCVRGDELYCRLPSGRLLTYQRPRLVPGMTPWGKPVEKITFEGWNSDYTRGSVGWCRMDTYGGKLTENVVQATSRDILAHAMLGLEGAGYPVVLHVHDEPVSEVPAGYGSVEQYEMIMRMLPPWCADWPISAAGGWRGQRYRKD